MSLIGPYMKLKELKAAADATAKGEGLGSPLPGVAADAYEMDKAAYTNNRALAAKIRKAVAEAKPDACDKGVPRFVWSFRMYPNHDSKHWDEAKKIASSAAKDAFDAVHKCGCGCAASCGSCPDPATAPARKRSEKKRSARRGRRK